MPALILYVLIDYQLRLIVRGKLNGPLYISEGIYFKSLITR